MQGHPVLRNLVKTMLDTDIWVKFTFLPLSLSTQVYILIFKPLHLPSSHYNLHVSQITGHSTNLCFCCHGIQWTRKGYNFSILK